ncbi:hypothetical protein PIB30_115559, partial [Stylosanthes scabra]|nr:hypothetical protein [Stylosanthes scabra]
TALSAVVTITGHHRLVTFEDRLCTTISATSPPLHHQLHLYELRYATTIVNFVSSDLAPTSTLCPPPNSYL